MLTFVIISLFIMLINIKHLKQKVYLFILVSLIAGCGGSNSSNSSNSQSSDASTNSLDIQIGNLATIPTENALPGESVPVYVNNNLNKPVNLTNIQLFDNGKDISNSVLPSFINSSNCLKIDARSSCKLMVYTNQGISCYLIKMTFTDESGLTYNTMQILNSHNQLPALYGFVYDKNNLSINNGLENTLTIPFRLANNYESLTVTVDSTNVPFRCFSNNYVKNTLCYALVTSDDLDSNSIGYHRFRVLGNITQTKFMFSRAMLSLVNAQNAHIVTSGVNVVINPDDGTSPQKIFLYNNGSATATNLIVTAANPITISSNSCGSSLTSGSSCSFFINVTGSIPSGQSSVGITYNDGSSTQAFYFNVSYISPIYSPGLTMTTSGTFSNIVISSIPSTLGVNIINTGTTTLRNLQFSNINNQVSTMSSFVVGSTCYNGIDLAVNESCVMVLSYSPSAVGSGTVNFIPIGTYTGQSGESLSYANSSLSIAYSAVTYPGFIAVGDYGSVYSALGAASTWSATVNTPFGAAATSANSMLINGSTYVMMLSTGAIRYSTLNGLFWTAATTTNLSTSTCGIIYDGSFYYTCGTSVVALGNCTNTGRGCIIRTNNLAGAWSGLYQPAQAVPINRIFYFTGTSNNAYVATVANATVNTGLATSTTGGTWAATSSGQTTAANNNMTCAVFNSTTQNVTAWDSVGWNSTRAIATIGTAWTANTTNRPLAASVNGAVFQNGIYSVVTSIAGGNGGVFTSATPTGTYTQVFTSTVNQLNGIAFGNGTYLAVGNNGAVAESATGSTWASQTAYVVGQSTNPNLNSAYYDGTNLWITGVNTIAKSPTTVPPTWTRPALISITKNGSNYLAVDNQGFIYSSSNLTSWTQQTNPSNQVLNDIYCASTNLCFAVGNSGTILKTTNGTSWTQLTSGVSVNLYGITCQQGICVVTGGTADNTGTILTSSNYTNWTTQISNLAKPLLSVTSYLGQFIAVGTLGRVYISNNNGLTWQLVFNNATGSLNSIACGNGCVAVGNSGLIVYSGNGTAWTSLTSPTTNNLNSIFYNGLFVATGNAGTIIYNQTPGITAWTTATFPAVSSNLTNLYAVISN